MLLNMVERQFMDIIRATDPSPFTSPNPDLRGWILATTWLALVIQTRLSMSFRNIIMYIH